MAYASYEEVARLIFSYPGGHWINAWTLAKTPRPVIDGIHVRGKRVKHPDPEDVQRAEEALRSLWRVGECRPMYNTYHHHHGHREYIALHPEWTPYPQGPTLADCWEDIEAINEHIEQMGECQRKGKMAVVREKDPDMEWMETMEAEGSRWRPCTSPLARCSGASSDRSSPTSWPT